MLAPTAGRRGADPYDHDAPSISSEIVGGAEGFPVANVVSNGGSGGDGGYGGKIMKSSALPTNDVVLRTNEVVGFAD